MKDLNKIGTELLIKEAKENNTVLKGCSISVKRFLNETNINMVDFIKNFNKHSFVIVKGFVMLKSSN